MSMSKQLRGSLFLLAAAIVWGMAFAAQSAAMDAVEPFTFNGARSLITFLALGAILLVKRDFARTADEREAPPGEYLRVGGVMGAIMFVATSLQQIGIVYTTAGKSGFITALYIIIVPLLDLFAGRMAGRGRRLLSVAVSLAGLWLLCGGGELGLGFGLGEGLTFGCAVAFSLHIIYIDRRAGGLNAAKLCLVQFLVSGLLCWIAAFIFETPRLAGLAACLPSLLYVGIASGAVGYTLQILGQKGADPTVASLLMCLESVFAAVGGWLLLGERLSPLELLGCALMLCACVIAQLGGAGGGAGDGAASQPRSARKE